MGPNRTSSGLSRHSYGPPTRRGRLVPGEVLSWQALAGAQYLSTEEMMSMQTDRALDRAQIELIAGRVSALNECFY